MSYSLRCNEFPKCNGILDHERKQKLEVKCLELEEELRDQGYDDDEIEEKVNAYRQMLLGDEQGKRAFHEVDEFGRPIAKDSHQLAQAQKEKNAKLKAAFGLKENFIDGSSFERNRIAQEKADLEIKEKKSSSKKRSRKPSTSSSSSDSESSSEKKWISILIISASVLAGLFLLCMCSCFIR